MLSRFTRTALTIQPHRTIHTSRALANVERKHTTDSYNKDIDPTPPQDSSIHRVDSFSENVQKPHEAPSGQWSRAGTQTSKYESVSKTEPYTAPGQDQRYGGKELLANEKWSETSKPGEGPEGKASGGRKPEGK